MLRVESCITYQAWLLNHHITSHHVSLKLFKVLFDSKAIDVSYPQRY